MTAELATADPKATSAQRKHGLMEDEIYWRDLQPWLEEHGYMLRPRYRPGWKPYEDRPGEPFTYREDSHWLLVPVIIDATRFSDGSLVIMKKVTVDSHPFELEVGQFLSSDEITSDPRNHCVRIMDVLSDPSEPNVSIVVLPYLRAFNDPEFLTFREALACLKQLIEGLRVMHENHVAHRDISSMNVMMDAAAMYPDMWHPQVPNLKYDYLGEAKHYSRTERPPKYYYIDFGLSRKYDPNSGPPQELPIFGGDKSVPEFQGDGYDRPANPFFTDIYYLGNLMRTQFVNQYRGFEFMQQLVTDMVQSDPEKRPTIAKVETQFDKSFRQLSIWKLRLRLVQRNEIALKRAIYAIAHIFRTAKYAVKRLPPFRPRRHDLRASVVSHDTFYIVVVLFRLSMSIGGYCRIL
ncbi:hypothetical protein EVJ58_g5351 [Rhodofomes roseus]|uniref:Protein kinase domain-containing protein n=1 Tax=Rhodofomes roseus TaxID=34475 RepID=A0A4Y9YD28_9APHY|nr:hypothetical protein EVJ58_g5351 [Rhodofomes roseus]